MGYRKYEENKVLGGDLANLLLLGFLYCLQGVPLGLCMGSLPFLLKKHISFAEVGIFSLASYPFSLKFFWSPMVDSYFLQDFGRRKSWIIPLQVLSGMLMLWLSSSIDILIQSGSHIYTLTFIFLLIVTIYATQDIAVDGWAIEILLPQNRPFASTAQSVGQTLGFFLSFGVLLALRSAEFCEALFGYSDSIMTLGTYLWAWGWINILSSLLICYFKHEDFPPPDKSELGFSIIFQKVYAYLRLPAVQTLIVILLTSRISSAAHDNALALVILGRGLPETYFGILAVIQLPIELAVSISVGYLCRKYSELRIFYYGFVIKLASCILATAVLYTLSSDEPIDTAYFGVIIVITVLSSIGSNFMYVSIFAFVTKIADRSMGGTFITLLATLTNFGNTWPKFFVFILIDQYTQPSICPTSLQPCSSDCNTECTPYNDGYITTSCLCISIGLIYSIFLSNKTQELENTPRYEWEIEKKGSKVYI